MSLIKRIRGLWRRVGRPPQRETDVNEELRGYVEELTERKIRSGWSPEAARRHALVETGAMESIKEEMREQRAGFRLDGWRKDIMYGLRVLRRSPGFTGVAGLSLALGIGANVAVFSVIDALLLRPLPVANPAALVSFTKIDAASPAVSRFLTYQEFERFRDRTRLFSGLLVSSGTYKTQMQVQGEGSDGPGDSIRAQRVSSNYFSTLGVPAILGRTFVEIDDRVGAPDPVVVLSYDFWQRRFGRDPHVLGRQIVVFRNIPFTVIGVAPRGFFGIEVDRRPDMWWPIGNFIRFAPGFLTGQVAMMGRLRSGVSLARARAEAAVIYPKMTEERSAESGGDAEARQRMLGQRLEIRPGGTGQTVAGDDASLVSGRDSIRGRFTQPLLILMASVVMLLLVASANVAALLLVRGTVRHRELAVRLALGSGRWRLIRQLFTENVALVVIAGLAGLGIAEFGIRILLTYAPAETAAALNAGLDGRVLAFTVGLLLSSVLLFGVAPAVRATGLNLSPSLKEGSSSVTAGRSRLTIHRVLVGSQIALSMVLLAGAGLLGRSLQNLRHVDPGFSKQGVVLFDVHQGAVRPDVARQMLQRLEAIPRAEAATFFSDLGLLGGHAFQADCIADGYTPRAGDDLSCVLMNVGPRFFETLGTPIVRGRAFRPDEGPGSPGVAIINETMAKQYFGDTTALGRRIGGREVVGVAKDAKYTSLKEQSPRTLYTPIGTGLLVADVRFALRTSAAATSLPNPIRSAVQQVAPTFQVTNLQTMNEVAEATLIQERFLVQLAGGFSMLALLLACIGLYGTVSYAVAQRANEIGIRMALGARAPTVIGMLMRETSQIVGAGMAVGLGVTLITTRALSSFLFGLSPVDPLTMGAAGVLLLTVTGCGAFVPVRRASRIDPMIALRHE